MIGIVFIIIIMRVLYLAVQEFNKRKVAPNADLETLWRSGIISYDATLDTKDK